MDLGMGGLSEQSRTTGELIEALSSHAAFDHVVEDVTVIVTHASIVFLAGDFVYKVKKAVDLGFLDYSTLARRHEMCKLELRLNARLAPRVYLGVVPVVARGTGLAFHGGGEPIEYAVKMRRLDDDNRLGALLLAGELETAHLSRLAEQLANFHREALHGSAVSAMAGPEIVAENCEGNFPTLRGAIGEILSQRVYDRVVALTRRELALTHERVQERSRSGIACETHGDLRLEHVYRRGDAHEFTGWEVIDGVEFSERFTFADPVSDIAFLVMDMRAHGFDEAATRFAERYFDAAGDASGRPLLPLYVAYRAAVRAKVRALQGGDPNISTDGRAAARQAARGHALQVVCELAPPSERPCVVLMSGLPGTGKSVVAEGLAAHAGFSVVRADVIRKQLAGLSPTVPANSSPGSGIYAPEWTLRTYAECLERTERLLFEGGRVIVDATFRNKEARASFIEAARRWFVPVVILHCTTDRATARERLDARVNDASDADWGVYVHMEKIWEDFGDEASASIVPVCTDGSIENVMERALAGLATRGLVGGTRGAAPGLATGC